MRCSQRNIFREKVENFFIRSDYPLTLVVELAGNTQMKTTQLYLVGTDDQRKKAIRALEALG